MRAITRFMLAVSVFGFALAPASGDESAFGTAPDAATESVVMPNTPSGTGDPNVIVCRAPQRIANSDQFGPKSCGHNSEWSKLAMSGKDLAPDGKTLIARVTVDRPKGDGDPDAVTCRTAVEIIDSSSHIRRHGPTVCRANRFWADANKRSLVVDAYGVVVNDASSGALSIYGQGYGPGMAADPTRRIPPP